MKTLLLAAVSLSALHANADACGTPAPTVFRLSSHYVVGGAGTDHRRMFVLLDEVAPKGLYWKQLSPMSYDATEIANAYTLAAPMTFTLVGPSGTRVVSTAKHFYLSKSWDFTQATGALEIDLKDDDNFAIAISGTQRRAQWDEVTGEETTKQLERWVAKQGVTVLDHSSIYASRIKGTDIEAVAAFDKAGKMITLIKDGSRLVSKIDGSVLGAIEIDGNLQLVVASGNRTMTMDV
jgi:hypothetical protein